MSATVGDTRPVPGKLCRGCGARGEWPGQPCPDCKPPSPAVTEDQGAEPMTATVHVQPEVEQRTKALGHANVIRLGRAAVKADIAAGGVSAAEIMSHPPSCVVGMLVLDVVRAERWVGPKRARQMLQEAGVGLDLRVGALGLRERLLLAGFLAAKRRLG